MTDALTAFAAGYDFELDEYQIEGCQALEAGSGVLVAAPTGAGKTVVGEFAVFLAVAHGRKCFYTTPIKALSNQKYHDLVARWGADRVGLLTGDTSLNADAQIVVMTTEVLRNMIYASSTTLHNLGFVVMDEVHYLADRFRGAVWEEVILGLADSVQLVALSATVSNVEEFGQWLTEVRGECAVVLSERRPVPLYQHVLVESSRLIDLFDGVAPTARETPSQRAAKVNRELLEIARGESRIVRDDARRFRGRDGRGRRRPPRGASNMAGASRRGGRLIRPRMAEALHRARLLPAICFIFSRAGCNSAVEQVVGGRVRLTNQAEAQLLGEIADRHVADLSMADLDALGYEDFRYALTCGVAAHHAGQLPAFKAIVEEGFTTGALKLVFATETLALGINMPAKTVVIEKLVKFNGEAHVDVTAGEYTQLTGRAGRRGIDTEGHAVVVWQQGMDPRAVAGLASRRTYPLKSSFAPSYNMAVNLMATVGRRRAREVLNLSFAQFQTDKTVVQAAKQEQRLTADLAELRRQVECHLGDAMAYARLRDDISSMESEGAKARKAERAVERDGALRALLPGDVVYLPKHGWAVVLGIGADGKRHSLPFARVMCEDHTVLKLRGRDLDAPLVAATRIRVPRRFDVRERRERRALLAAMRDRVELTGAQPPETEPIPTQADITERVAQLRRELKRHPVHECPDREIHAVAAAQLLRLEREQREQQRRTRSRKSLAQQFDQVLGVLQELGYLDGEELTPAGNMLRRIYNELDLVAAECIRAGVFDGLDAPELAAVLSTLVYETRPGQVPSRPRMPTPASEQAQSAVRGVWRDVGLVERHHGQERGRGPDIGFAEAAWRWAAGADLAKVLMHCDLPAGDFVRWIRQVIDLADQIAQAVGPSDLRRTCREVMDCMRRGVVAVEIGHE